MSWDPDARLAVIRFERETRPTGHDARVLVDAMTRWIGADDGPFALLGDGGKLAGLDAEYRAVWGRFFRQHRKRCWIAFFHMNAFVRIAADMFRIGTGVRMKAFGEEQAARAWLREKGIDA